jgi:hypothetical protein
MPENEALTLEEAVDQIAEQFDDGFQMEDLWEVIPTTMNIVESFKDLSGTEKKEKAVAILDKVLDKFDLPGPDWITKKVIMWFLPGAIDKLVEAAKGKFNF